MSTFFSCMHCFCDVVSQFLEISDNKITINMNNVCNVQCYLFMIDSSLGKFFLYCIVLPPTAYFT